MPVTVTVNVNKVLDDIWASDDELDEMSDEDIIELCNEDLVEFMNGAMWEVKRNFEAGNKSEEDG